MTAFSRTVFVSATYALEDFPTGLGSAQAFDYLTAWTSLWDPRLLAAAGGIPEWRRGDSSGLDLEDSLICCPEASLAKIDQPLEERIRLGRNHFIPTARRPRREVVQSLLDAYLQGAESSPAAAPLHSVGVADEACALLDDFYAFGYLALQIQCMARTLRYSFNLDWMRVCEQLLSAAKSSILNDAEETDRWLAAAFDSLSQERDRYCSQQGNLLDLVLLAPSTLGSSLAEALTAQHPLTIYATTRVLRQMQQANPAAWEQLSSRLQEKTACLAGGLRDELPHVWLPEDAFIRELQHAREDCDTLGIAPPDVWMRFSPMVSNGLSTIGRQFGFVGAILAPLAGGSVPKKDHAKVRWQGAGDRDSLDCILGQVHDAANGETLLNLGNEMARQLDYHQVPTVVVGRWPGVESAAYRDLVRAAARSPALGKWTHASSYFASTAQGYWSDRFSSQDFQFPLPSSPIELHARHLQIQRQLPQAYRLEHLESVCRLWQWTPRLGSQPSGPGADLQTYLSRCCSLRDALEAGSIDHLELAGELDRLAAGIASELRARVTQGEEDIVFNATSLGKQVFLEDYPRCVDPHSSTRIAACSDDGLHSQCVVDVPPFGFVKGVSRPPSAPSDPHRQRDTSEVRIRNASWLGRVFGSRPAVVLEDGSMANDFMEVQIDPSKGYLRSMYVLNQRGNRLSGQVSWVPQPLQPRQALNDDSFQVLLDPQMRVVHSSKVRGTIEVTGRLAGGVCAIRYTLWHGARWLEIEIQGDGADAGVGFPVWRMVWPSEAATIAAWSQGTKGKLPAPLQCAVELIEIDDVDHRIHYATGGLSMHRRYGHRALASIVPVDSEGQYHAKLAVGLNWPNPWETAIDRMVPNLVSVSTASGASMGKSPDTGAWLARCNMSNLRFRWIDPRTILKVSSISEVEIEDAIAPDACLWVVETAGKAGTARVGCVRPIQRAWRVDFRGCEYDRLKVEQGEVLLPFEGWERSRVALCFES